MFLMNQLHVMPINCVLLLLSRFRLYASRLSYDLFVYDFLYDFFGIVGGYMLQMYDVCVYIAYDHLTISFGDKLGQNFTETLRISYDNRTVIVQSSCYLHDIPI